MILKLYKEITKGILTNYKDIVEEAEILYSQSSEPWKMRIWLIDDSFVDIYLSLTGKYSYHWDRSHINRKIFRFDNAPHQKWKTLETYPDHFHDGSEENVKDSQLPGNQSYGYLYVFNFIKENLINENQYK